MLFRLPRRPWGGLRPPFAHRVRSYTIAGSSLLFACAPMRDKSWMVTTGHMALRKGRVSLPGHIYLLTTVTENRAPHFATTDLARTVCRMMLEHRTWGDATALCWVLMPDHWHGLIELGDHDDLSVVMNRFKSLTSKALQPLARMSFRWARGFHDHAMRQDENLLVAARYIIANPIRAGLATDVNDYPYWNSTWL